MESTIGTPNVPESVITEVVKGKEKNSFIIPWEKDGDLKFSAEYFTKFYQGEKPIKEYRAYHRVVEIDSVRKFKWSFFLRDDRKKGDVGISLEIMNNGLKAKCDGKKRHERLCDLIIIGLYQKFLKSNEFLQNLYVKEIDLLPASQHRFFQLKVTEFYNGNHKVYFKNHVEFGQVYSFFEDDKLERGLKENLEPHFFGKKEEPNWSSLIYVIPIDRHINGLPVIIPFSVNEKLNSLGDDFTFNDFNISDFDIVKVSICKKILSLSRRLVEDVQNRGDSEGFNNEAFVVGKNHLMDTWRRLLDEKTGNELQVTFVDRNKKSTAYEYLKYPPKYRMIKRRVVLAGGDLEMKFNVKEESDHLVLSLELYYKGSELKGYHSECHNHFFFINLDEYECLFVDQVPHEFLIRTFSHIGNKITVLKKDYLNFFENILSPLSRSFPIVLSPLGTDSVLIPIANPNRLYKVIIHKEDDYANFKLNYVFNDQAYEISHGGNLILRLDNNNYCFIERDGTAENEFSDFVEKQLPYIEICKNKALKRLNLNRYFGKNWLYEFKKKCDERGYNVVLNNIKPGESYYPFQLRWELLDIRQENNVFSIYMVFKFGKIRFTPSEFESLMEAGQHVDLGNELYGYIKTADKHLFEPLFTYGTVEAACIKLTSAQLLSFQTRLNKIDSQIIQSSISGRREKLMNINEISLLDIPQSITANLRPYQQTGFSWMAFLNEFQWGGILADDMGLGKTLQAITLLEYFYQDNPSADPSIIVVPNSLIFNWVAEFKKFAPNRNTLVYHGQKRKEVTIIMKGSVLITTYGTVMTDLDFFKEQSFSYMILDESQSVKNRNSKRFKSLVELQTYYRIAMTGTPIENRVEDIFAQMSIVNPGFFGNYRNFNKTYGGIQGDETVKDKTESLQKMIEPFILRRTKKQVALDLPEKTETVLYLDMTPEQRKIYDRFRKIFKGELEDNLASSDSSKSKFLAIEALQKLRQLCNSPILMKDGNLINESIKLDFMNEIMEEVAPNHKILLFSSSTAMLKLIAQRIDNYHIGYTYLDGKMNQEKRQSAVETFQKDDTCRVFLISLKAGGTGLNLTAADYVYILDPWWNPAAEAQAIDRCYRIGQDKHVMAYKIVCKDSVEEYILAMQNRKKRLAEGLILDESNLMKSISKEELLKLFD